MRTYRIVISDRAEDALAAIQDYIAKRAGAETARTIRRALFRRCHELDTFPDRGTPRPDLAPGIRTVPHRRKATIGYVVDGDAVVVIGVAWRGQDLATAFGLK